MKNLQQAIEEILNRNIQFEVNFERADDPTGDIVYKGDLIKELTQLITSREQEIREEAVRGFVEFNKGRLRTQSFNVEQLKQLYFDDVESALEYLSQQKENK